MLQRCRSCSWLAEPSADRWAIGSSLRKYSNIWRKQGRKRGKSAEEKVHFLSDAHRWMKVHNGGQRERLLGRREPASGLLRIGLWPGGGTRSGGRHRAVARIFPPHSGDPQRTLHGILAPQRLCSAEEEEWRVSEVRLWHGEQNGVSNVPLRSTQLREPKHRPHSDPPVRVHVTGLQVGPLCV